jgi:hypothetical protein
VRSLAVAVAAALAAGLAPPTSSAAAQPAPTSAGARDADGAPAATEPTLLELLDQLSAASDADVAGLVASIERLGAATGPSPAALPDALFTAARACEERLLDPSRALALYRQILARFPDARVAVAAGRRAEHLRQQVGASGASAEEARALAALIAAGESLPLGEALRRADALAERSWPGAAEAALWSAELARRRGAAAEAIARYQRVLERFAADPAAILAARGLAGVAVEQGDWALAERMALALPQREAADVVTRAELLDKVATGRLVSRWLRRAYRALALVGAALLLSLLQVSGVRRPGAALRALWPPPLEVVYMAPVAALLIGASLTTHTSLAPAVSTICLGGLALSWLSGAALTQARRRGREARWRSATHILLGVIAALALMLVAVQRGDLLDMLIATLQVGPER